jgi:hypothetical protein
MNEQNGLSTVDSKRGTAAWLPIVGAGILAVAGAGYYYQSNQTTALKTQFQESQKDNAALRAELSDTDSSLRKSMEDMKSQLEQARSENSAIAQKAQGVASRHADIVANRVIKQEEERNKALTEQLDQMKAANLDASAKLDGRLNGINDEVGTVKTDVASTKTDLEDTKTDLQRARGDMGMMSGLIATNSKDIQRLRELGDRNIYEFTISKTNATQKVGDIQVALRKADVKRNRYTVDVLADDKRVEKKDRTINEPVQFYTAGAHQPYELVVNQISKDKIVGYLATPKVMVSRADQ